MVTPELPVAVEPAPDGTDAVGSTPTGTDLAEPGAVARPWSWHFVRVSGLFLAVMLVVQFSVAFLTTDIARTTAFTVTERWHDLTWRTFEVLTLLLAVAHGTLALRSAARAGAPGPRSVVLQVVVLALGAVLVVATLAVAFTLH